MIFKTKHNNDLYNKLVILSRNNFFYKKLSFEDSFETRIYLIFFFLSLILIMNKKKKNKPFPQEVFDGIFKYTEFHIREIGYGDVAVNKKMKLLTKVFYDILLKLDMSNQSSIQIDKNILKKYFPILDPKNTDLFENILNNFYNYCYELNEKRIIEGDINFEI